MTEKLAWKIYVAAVVLGSMLVHQAGYPALGHTLLAIAFVTTI